MTRCTWFLPLAAGLLLCGPAREGRAQEVPSREARGPRAEPAFEAGDRVEIDPLLMSNPAHARWRGGTVKSVDVGGSAYVVEADGPAGRAPEIYVIPMTRPEKWIRPVRPRDGDDDDEPAATEEGA